MTTQPIEPDGSSDIDREKQILNQPVGENPSSDNAEIEKAPDGGLRAWLVAGGGAAIFFSALGFANSTGVFQQYYMTHQLRGQSPDNIAWIGSLMAFLQFAGGAIGGPLFDRYGAWVLRPAVLMYIFALMMMSLCDKYWQFMLAQGVLLGLSMGFMQFPAMAAVSQYFDKKRAAALGLTVAGSSIGGIVMPIALSKMLNSSTLGFGWSVRIIAFAEMPLIAFALIVIKSRLPPRTTAFFIPSAFKDAKFTLIVAAFFFMILGMFTPLFYIPTYAVSKGVDPTLASYLLAVINAASTFGRIIPGILADKFGRLNIFGIGGIATGVVLLCWTEAKTTAALVVYSIFIGFTSGSIVSGGSAAITTCPKDPHDFGTFMGMGIGISSIAALISPPINGALENQYGGFLQSSIFSGVMCLAGGVIALAAKTTTPQGLLKKL